MGVKLLGKIKIHEIAKKIGLTSKEIIERAQKIGVSVTSHLSSVDDVQAKKIEDSFGDKVTSEQAKTVKAKETKETKKESAPVIIRREVIISEEEEQEVEKKQENNSPTHNTIKSNY